MTGWVLEHEIWLLVLGALTAILTGGLWLKTGARPFCYALVAVVLATALLVTLSGLIVTDRETITATLAQIARDVQRNDLEAVLAHVHSKASEIRRRAELEFPAYEFREVRIQENLEIDVREFEASKTAEARFNVVVLLRDRRGLFQESRIPRFVVVSLEQEDQRWKVTDYRHSDAREGLLRRTNR